MMSEEASNVSAGWTSCSFHIAVRVSGQGVSKDVRRNLLHNTYYRFGKTTHIIFSSHSSSVAFLQQERLDPGAAFIMRSRYFRKAQHRALGAARQPLLLVRTYIHARLTYIQL